MHRVVVEISPYLARSPAAAKVLVVDAMKSMIPPPGRGDSLNYWLDRVKDFDAILHGLRSQEYIPKSGPEYARQVRALISSMENIATELDAVRRGDADHDGVTCP